MYKNGLTSVCSIESGLVSRRADVGEAVYPVSANSHPRLLRCVISRTCDRIDLCLPLGLLVGHCPAACSLNSILQVFGEGGCIGVDRLD
jgi:hypothetical protein